MTVQQKKYKKMGQLVPLPTESHILWGYAFFARGRFAEAAPHFEIAKKQIEKDTWIKAEEKRYLLAYIDDLEEAETLMKSGIDPNTISANGAIDLTKVSSRLKRMFPLRGHPNWRELD